MRLDLVEGPIGGSMLRDVARLYGAFNLKYREADYCRRLFEANPHGRSLHAIVVDGAGDPIGHYAVVPMALRVEGERRLSGKGEAYVVRADRRDATVQVGDDPPLSVGMALPLHLYPFAFARGLEPVHMMAPPEVAPIHRLAGCRTLVVLQQRLGIAFAAGAPPGASRFAAGAYAAAVVSWTRVRRALAGAAGRWRASIPNREQFARAASDAAVTSGWGLDLDAQTLEWQHSLAAMEWVELEDGTGYALVCAAAGNGRAAEVLQLRARRSDAYHRLLAAVILRAARHNALLTLSDQAAEGPDRAEVVACARSLGLRARPPAPSLLINSSDRYYHHRENLRFTPYFHAAF